MAEKIWEFIQGDSPLMAVAPHDGHDVRDELLPYYNLNEQERLYEEDPFTKEWAKIAPTYLYGTRSRFEVDLNRPTEIAIYQTPEQAWGLKVWKEPLPQNIINRTIENYHAFYDAYLKVIQEIEAKYGYIVVLDIHTYCHQRDGSDMPPAPAIDNPEINIGTSNMDSTYWRDILDTFAQDLRSYNYMGRQLDVREDIRWRGGPISWFVHDNFPRTGVSINIEVKKFFMDEHTGEPDWEQINTLTKAFESTLPNLLDAMKTKFGK
jgi:N-formylglutamate deformylase